MPSRLRLATAAITGTAVAVMGAGGNAVARNGRGGVAANAAVRRGKETVV